MTAVLLNLLTFLLGLVLGHWLAIGRDRRNEFNAALRPIRNWLLIDIDSPSPYTPWPSPIEIDTFIACLPPWRRRGFRNAIQKHHEAHLLYQTQTGSGSVQYTDLDALRATLRDCMRYAQRR